MCDCNKGHCSFTATMSYLQMRTKTATRTSEWATAALDGLCRACILQNAQWCKVCFVDVSRTWKATQGTNNRVDFLKARFIGYLHMRVTSTVSSASELSTSTTSTKRSASDSPLASSMPTSRPPTQKRPVVVHTDRDARIIPTAKDPLCL